MTASSDRTPSERTRGRAPLIVLIAAIVVVALAATGIGIAIGAGGSSAPRASDPDPVTAGSPSPSTGSSDSDLSGQASAFASARDAALKAVKGTATEIERQGEGWEVDVRKDGSSEDVDVVLGRDFSVSRVDDSGDDTADGADLAPLGTLAGDALGRAIDAALAKAGSGTAVSIELADTAPEAYDVKVSQSGAETKVVLGEDYSVIRTEQDD